MFYGTDNNPIHIYNVVPNLNWQGLDTHHFELGPPTFPK